MWGRIKNIQLVLRTKHENVFVYPQSRILKTNLANQSIYRADTVRVS